MKRVLVMVDWYEPGFKAGGPIRSCVNLVRKLSSKADVSVVTRNTDYHDTEGYKDIEPDKFVEYNRSRVYYFSKNNLTYSSLKTLLIKENPDVLYLNSMFSVYFTILPFIIAKTSLKKTKVIIAPRGMLAPGALSIKPFKKKLFLFLFKIFGGKKIEMHATNQEEAMDIKNVFPSADIHIAANLVIPDDKVKDHISKEKKRLKLISIARISPEKNLRYALEVLEEVEMPVQLIIYGTINDEAYWKQCQKLIGQMPQHEIIYKGFIEPEQIPDALSSSHFLFMPTLGENFGHIIFESFSAGTPVIISDRTPWRNLSTQDVGYDIRLEKKQSFVHRIEELVLMDGPSYQIMSSAASEFAKRYVEEKNDLTSYQFLYK